MIEKKFEIIKFDKKELMKNLDLEMENIHLEIEQAWEEHLKYIGAWEYIQEDMKSVKTNKQAIKVPRKKRKRDIVIVQVLKEKTLKKRKK